jgi:Putative Flp pilus-assembly TadE/G-like
MKMNRWNWKPRSDRAGEAGQSIVFITLVLGIFLLGALCFAFDLSNMWFHRQAAQSAADAACAAGAMDILVDAEGGATGKQGFTLGTGYTCSTSSTDAVCSYAAKNGYSSNSLTPGNVVSVSFPTTTATGAPPGVLIPPSSIAGTYPFIRVDVVDHVQTFFAGILGSGASKDVRTFSTCGVELATAPIPLIVLDPRSTDGATLSVQGTPTISIYGGPQQSIQVDSNAAAAVNIGGSAQVDLSHGGPGSPPTGSNLGVYGGPKTAPSGFLPGSTGSWLSPSSPINDPFAQIPAPAQPTTPGTVTSVVPGTHGCPVIGVASCDHYTPGYYPGPTGISISGSGGPNAVVSIFDPGIYYIVGGFNGGPNSCMRPSTDVGDGSGGTMFYFADTNSVSVDSNSGKKCPTDPTTFFNTTSGSGSIAFGAKCTAASTIPGNLPATLSGSVLLGPCQAPTVSTLCAPNCAINYGDPLGTTDPIGEQRGFLFFQNRAKNASTNPKWQGGGQFLLSGTMYFHQCVTSGSDTGTGCSTTNAFHDNVSLSGNSGSGTYILGQIVADQISLGGTSALTMDLNPTSVFSVLKASIFQ